MKGITPDENVATSNVVRLIGSVIAKNMPASSDFIRLKIAVSSSIDKKGFCIVPICFYGAEAATQIDQAIRCDENSKPRVEIIGFVQTSKRIYTSDNEKPVAEYYQDIVGTSIAFARSSLESAFALPGLGNKKAESMNQFICFGRIVNAYSSGRDDRATLLTVKTWHNAHANFPQITCRGMKVLQIARNVRNNDYVAAIGEINPQSAQRHGRTVFIPRLYVNDIQRIPNNSVRHITSVSLELASDDIIFQKNSTA